MVRNAIFNGLVQFAHSRWKVRSKAVALALAQGIVDEWLDEEPVQLEAAYQSAVIASE